MFQVKDVWDEAKKIVGICDDAKLFAWLSDSVDIIANKGDFEGWKGYLDICTTGAGRCITLPREVGTVYSVNIGGNPTLGFGQLFSFHLNGPGDCRPMHVWSWQDQGVSPIYRDLPTPAKLVAYAQTAADNNKKVVVHGYDSAGNRLRYSVGNEVRDGYPINISYGYSIPASDAPLIARIVGITKDETVGTVRLSTLDDDGVTGVLLGVYEPDEVLPQLRRIKLGTSCSWVRVAFRKANPKFTSLHDHVPLSSRLAFLLALQARKFYSERNLADANGFEANAARLELEAQSAQESPTMTPIQVVNLNGVVDQTEDIR